MTQSPNVLGDYNGNHVVDAADYTVWRDRMASGGSLPNDASPGSVTVADYTYWKTHFGATGGSGGSVAAVPEPASVIFAGNRRGGLPWFRRSCRGV